MLLEPSQARSPATPKNTGQGVANNSLSSHTKKNIKGSKNASILLPNSLVKSLNAASTQLRELIITSPGIEITLFTNKLKSEVVIESPTFAVKLPKYSICESGLTERIEVILTPIFSA